MTWGPGSIIHYKNITAFSSILVVCMLIAVVVPANAIIADADGDTYDYEVSAPSKTSPNVQIAEGVKVGEFTVKYSNPGIFTGSGTYSISGIELLYNGTAVDGPIGVTVSDTLDYAVLALDSTGLDQGKIYNACFTVQGTSVMVMFTVGSGYWAAEADFSTSDTQAVSVDVTGRTSANIMVAGVPADKLSSISLDSVTVPGMSVSLKKNAQYINGGFVRLSLSSIVAANAENGTYDLVLRSENDSYTVKLTVTGGKDPAPAVTYDYEVSAPSKTSPNVQIAEEAIPKMGYISGISIKYSNDAIDPQSTISSSNVLLDGVALASYSLSSTHPSGAKYVEMTLTGMSMLNNPALLELKVSFTTDSGLETYSVFMPSAGYWFSIIDSKSDVQPTLECYKETEYDGEIKIAVTGMTTVDSISFTIPGVSLQTVSNDYATNGGFVILSGSIDWSSVVNGTYPVTIRSGNDSVIFNLMMSKATLIDSTSYDFEFIGVTTNDPGIMNWYLDTNDSITVKVQLPNMSADIGIGGSYTTDSGNVLLSSVVNIDIKENSVDGKYVVFEMTNKSLTAPLSLTVNLSSGNMGIVGNLTLNIVEHAPSPQEDREYVLEYEYKSVGANTHLDVNITKTSGAHTLEQAKLLVIAKYEGGIVINVYTSPILNNGCGTDVVEVSSFQLVEVILELVDGFQSSTPIFYGSCVYRVGGASGQ